MLQAKLPPAHCQLTISSFLDNIPRASPITIDLSNLYSLSPCSISKMIGLLVCFLFPFFHFSSSPRPIFSRKQTKRSDPDPRPSPSRLCVSQYVGQWYPTILFLMLRSRVTLYWIIPESIDTPDFTPYYPTLHNALMDFGVDLTHIWCGRMWFDVFIGDGYCLRRSLSLAPRLALVCCLLLRAWETVSRTFRVR